MIDSNAIVEKSWPKDENSDAYYLVLEEMGE
jgi:hypothetical protein